MGASIKNSGSGGRRGRRGGKRHTAMSEINVTPFVDVMLVLLIIFMVTAPMLTAGVPLDLPSAKGKELPTPSKEPLVVSVDRAGMVFLQNTDKPVAPDKLIEQLKAIIKTRGGSPDDAVFVRGHKGVEYEKVVNILSILKSAGFGKVSLVTSPEGAKG